MENLDSAEPGRVLLHEVHGKLSQRLWGWDWGQILPLKMHSDGIVAERGTYEEVCAFAQENFEVIYEQDPQAQTFLASELSASKAEYYHSQVDIALFKHKGRTVGLFTCNPTDWNSYYIRNCSILPAYQGKRLCQTFLELVINQCTLHRVARLETDTSPSNQVIIHLLNQHEFNITAMQLSERWGSMLRLTKFLNPANTQVFLKQFCWGVFHQLKPNQERSSS